MAIVQCINCKNWTNQVKKVSRGGACEETPHCKASWREHLRLIKEEARAFAEVKRRRKQEKNARNKANRAARAKENQDRASGDHLEKTFKMGK